MGRLSNWIGKFCRKRLKPAAWTPEHTRGAGSANDFAASAIILAWRVSSALVRHHAALLLLNGLGVRKFDVMIDGQCRAGLAEDCVEELYRTGDVLRGTRCRPAGRTDWQTVDECIPILKYVHQSVRPVQRSAAAAAAVAPPPRRKLHAEPLLPETVFALDDRQKPSLTSSLKAGWICFGFGVAAAWIFPPAYLFYSVAVIMAIVAMCTHQVSRGLILMLSTFVAIGTSAFLSFILAVGMFAVAMKPVTDKMEADVERWRKRDRELEQQLRRTEAEMTRTMQRATSQLDSIFSATPKPRRSPVTAPFLPDTPNRSDLLREIARLEEKERQLRRQGRSLDPFTTTYLQELRRSYDKSGDH